MSRHEVTIEPADEAVYVVRVTTPHGTVELTLDLRDAPGETGGALASDEATARATLEFLLSHQEAFDLPRRIEIGDVVAAYPDAAERITGHRRG